MFFRYKLIFTIGSESKNETAITIYCFPFIHFHDRHAVVQLFLNTRLCIEKLQLHALIIAIFSVCS